MERQTSGLEVGEWLWIPSVTEAWQAGVIIAVGQGDGVDSLVVEVPNSTGAPRERVTISLGSQHAGSAAAFHRWNKDLLSIGGVNTAQDLSKLALLHEPAVLQALQLRFAEGIVYTSSGPVLLAVNPYRQLPDLYDNTMLRSFMDLQLGETAMPHIYGTANDAYNAVWHKSASQTVLVSGESGSGKTETTKFVMRFIAFASAGGEGDAMSVMEKQVLESIPLLEALGNAKTLRNDNSSRFGKYIEMQLRVERGTQGPQLIGARTHTYLLEKVRVMGAREGERSFHIFYQVLAAASTASASSQTSPTQDAAADEDSFHSTSQPLLVNGISIHGLTQGPELGTVFRPRDFTYLNHSSCEVVANCDEVNEFNRTLAAMRAFNMADSDISHVLSSLMAVLHLGNLAFRAPSGNSEGSEIDVDVPGCPLHTVSSLLGISATGLQDALCRRKVQVTTPRSGPDGIQQTLKMAPHRTCAQALEGRNALARHLYGAIFNFVVMQVNIVLSVSSAPASRGKCSDSSLPFVGVLDIFGFEFFKNNSFEQLCVNFTNELLQQYFNEVIFKHEAALYIREQVPWDPQDFPDNSAIVELVAGVPSNPLAGVFPMLDEECNITGGTHMTWCSKLNSRYRHSELFKVVLIRRENFTIQHFAGPVEYTSDQFLEKNRDILSAEVLECMHCSKNTFIRDRFLEHGRLFGAQRDASTSGRVTRARAYSVSSEFRQQLKVLMQNIRATTPHFVRCIKPNPRSLPREFDRPSVVEQLRYQGVLEAIRVSRAGYPLRLRHREAVFRYRPLMPRALCQRLDVELASQKFEASARRLFEFLQKGVLGMKAESVQVGDTLVFFKNDALILLDASLQQARSKAATRVQAGWRGAVVCRQYHRTRKAALILQAVTRGILARRFVVQFRRARAAITLQRVERGRRARCIFLERLGAMIKIQRRVKAWQARIFFCKAMKATVRLQRWHHSTVQRIRYRKCVRAAMQVQRCWRGMRGRIYAARFLHTQNKASLRIARHWRFWVLTRIRDRAASQTGFISGSPGCAHEKQCEHADGESSSCSSLLGSTGELLAAIECLRSLSDATSYEISSLRRSCSTADIQLQSLRSEEDRAHRQLHQDEEQPREISDCSSWRSPSLPLFSPSPSRGFSARLFCENNSQRGFSKFWTCIGHKRHADDLPRPHRWADKLAARARRRAPRRFKYQGLLTQATAIAGQVVADHTAHISSQALEVVPQVSGSWSWIVISSAEVQVQKLVHLILTYNFVASGARGTEALRGNFSVPMYTKSELQVMHPIRLHEHAVMLLQSVQRARALSEAPAADDMELIPWILRAQQLYTDEQQSARGLCNQESLSRLAAMCLGFLGGREEEGFWLLHCFAEEVLGFRSIKADADAALFVEMLAHEAPQLASALSVDVLEEAAASLVVQCWPCAFVNFLIDEPLIRLWEELLNRQSSACPRFPLFKWLLGLVRSAEPAIMQMLPIWPVREVVPQLCSHVRQIARTLPADWRPRLSLSDRQLLKLIAAAARRRPPARDDHAASWIYVQ